MYLGYKCKKCDNTEEFEEINVVKTYIALENGYCNHQTSDEFFYKENVVCLKCGATKDDNDVEDKSDRGREE
ncbi:MAG: hypothetical protein ACRDD7_03970 [Peptostreptococcaceae bacterium]